MVELRDGSHMRVPSSWTDDGDVPAPELTAGARLSLSGVRELVARLVRMTSDESTR